MNDVTQKHGFRRRAIYLIAVMAPFVGDLTQLTLAGDWPQILGPARNGVAQGETLDATWPKTGPALRWKKNVGDGLAGIAVAGGRAVLFHRKGNRQVVETMNAATGKVLWRTALPTQYVSNISPDSGPRCVPVIHKDAVYLFGAGGELFSLALDSGKQRWLRDTRREFKSPEGYFGVGSTPIVEDGKLLVNIGSRDGAGVVALDLANGRTIWKSTNELASYSSPVAVTLKLQESPT